MHACRRSRRKQVARRAFAVAGDSRRANASQSRPVMNFPSARSCGRSISHVEGRLVADSCQSVCNRRECCASGSTRPGAACRVVMALASASGCLTDNPSTPFDRRSSASLPLSAPCSHPTALSCDPVVAPNGGGLPSMSTDAVSRRSCRDKDRRLRKVDLMRIIYIIKG